MTEFSTLLQQGNAWLFVPSAILLGALHGLEPGHSKTMMAAFIVAIRGTVTQAILLGVSATISHTAVVWAVAMAGLYFGRNWNAEATEPYFQVASAVLIVGVAAWMLWRIWREQQLALHHDHDHHHDEAKLIDTGHGVVRLEVFEDGVPPRFRLRREGRHGHVWPAAQVAIETGRPMAAARRSPLCSVMGSSNRSKRSLSHTNSWRVCGLDTIITAMTTMWRSPNTIINIMRVWIWPLPATRMRTNSRMPTISDAASPTAT